MPCQELQLCISKIDSDEESKYRFLVEIPLQTKRQQSG